MLTPQYLASCSDDIVALYSQLEIDVLQDIARRIKATGVVSSSAQWQIRMLQESGSLYDEIIAKIAKINQATRKDITSLFEESGTKSLEFDNEIFKSAGLSGVSAVNAQILSAGINKTLGEVFNMTMTTARAGQQQFVNASTKAYMQVASGAFDYNTAISNACREVARTGLQTIVYDSGATISLEAGIRRNVMTGINQTAQQITEYNCDELGCDLVETSSHSGARPDHALWQGKIFSRSGKDRKYPEFVSSTGYGSVTGLGGANCRHSYYPYFEGDVPQRTKAELDRINSEAVEYNGKTLSRYDAEQQQRSNERNIRRFKREQVMMEAAGLDSSLARKKVREWNAKAQDFADMTGIVRQKPREKVFTEGRNSGIMGVQGGHSMNNYSSGGFYGALDPDSFEAIVHGEKYYEAVRSMKTDYKSIALNTGWDEQEILDIKNHIFIDKHDLGRRVPCRFDPDYHMAQSWQRLIEGKDVQEMDIILLQHEHMELNLMKQRGLSYQQAHELTAQTYSYSDYVKRKVNTNE